MGDWVDIAWSFILDQAPAMGDQARYRHVMHKILWLGEEPEWTAEERKQQAEREIEEARAAIGAPVAEHKIDEMKALMQRAAELRKSGS
jgi:hypothetical protein